MKYKRGDIVRLTNFNPISQFPLRGVVVEAKPIHYNTLLSDYSPPVIRVLWSNQAIPEWHYEEDICLVG